MQLRLLSEAGHRLFPRRYTSQRRLLPSTAVSISVAEKSRRDQAKTTARQQLVSAPSATFGLLDQAPRGTHCASALGSSNLPRSSVAGNLRLKCASANLDFCPASVLPSWKNLFSTVANGVGVLVTGRVRALNP